MLLTGSSDCRGFVNRLNYIGSSYCCWSLGHVTASWPFARCQLQAPLNTYSKRVRQEFVSHQRIFMLQMIYFRLRLRLGGMELIEEKKPSFTNALKLNLCLFI